MNWKEKEFYKRWIIQFWKHISIQIIWKWFVIYFSFNYHIYSNSAKCYDDISWILLLQLLLVNSFIVESREEWLHFIYIICYSWNIHMSLENSIPIRCRWQAQFCLDSSEPSIKAKCWKTLKHFIIIKIKYTINSLFSNQGESVERVSTFF